MAIWAGSGWAPAPRRPLFGALAGDWTYTAGDYEERGGVLYLAAPRAFVSPATPSSGTPGAGRAFANAARLASASIASGALTLTTDTTSTFHTTSSQTALRLDRALPLRAVYEDRLFLAARVELTAGDLAGQGPRLGLLRSSGVAVFGNVGIVGDGAEGAALTSLINTTSPANAALSQAAAHLAVEICGTTCQTWYVDTDDADVDISAAWTRHATDSAAFTLGDTLSASLLNLSKGEATTGFYAQVGLWRVPREEASDLTVWPGSALRPVWTPTADLFATTGPVASVQIQMPASVTVTAADVRSALSAAAVGLSSGITARARRGAAPAGAYAAISALTLEAGSGDDLYIDVKMTSDGYAPVGLRPVVL